MLGVIFTSPGRPRFGSIVVNLLEVEARAHRLSQCAAHLFFRWPAVPVSYVVRLTRCLAKRSGVR